jgi:hypothetical protein
MASASPDQGNQNPPLIQRILEAWQSKFPVFEQRRLAGAPPKPEVPSDSDILPVPEEITVQSEDESSIELVPETEAATWLTTHVRSTEDIMLSRIPAWGVEGVTTCIFPKIVALRWPSIIYEPIGKAETSCLRVKNIREKGKGCVATRAVPRGEPVARERALLVMPRTCLSPRQFVNAATNTMMPNQRAAFFALHNCNPAGPNDALSIISTNSFLIPGVPGHDVLYSAVFETLSRLNHRCRIFASFRSACPGTNEASPAVAQMRCSDGIVGHSLEKSEHYAPSPQAKRSRFLISKELWSLVRLRMNVKSSSLSAITSNARVQSVGGPRKWAVTVTKKGRSSPHP